MAIFNGWRITRTGVVFVIGVIVLAGLVFGGVLLVRERGEQARRQEAIKIAEQNLENQSSAPAASNDSSTSSSTETATKPGVETSQTSTDTTTVATSSTETTSELPQTGPSFYPVIIVALLALAAAYYLTSRRAVREL
ncbi:MAG: hypothetical protein JWM52_162 [Candidatus Saccharibacteria bacterium]|nr:hypothetical protein [Candidatus Saccharibacteria bacterium]